MGAPSPAKKAAKKAANRASQNGSTPLQLVNRVRKLEEDVDRLKQVLAAIIAQQAAKEAQPQLAQELQAKILAELNGEQVAPDG